jgi:hypothetical protein
MITNNDNKNITNTLKCLNLQATKIIVSFRIPANKHSLWCINTTFFSTAISSENVLIHTLNLFRTIKGIQIAFSVYEREIIIFNLQL